MPVEFVIFGLTLLGVAIFHNKTLWVALAGLLSLLTYKLGFTDFPVAHHLHEELPLLLNLFGLLVGFTVLAGHFERSGVPEWLPRLLPNDWKGGFVLLVIVFGLSAVLDNIAAALIGATIARTVFCDRLHIGYLAAIVASSNAGGAPSVVGDTTTTMIWLAGVEPLRVLPALIASIAAFLFFGIIGSVQQDRYQRITRDERIPVRIDRGALATVLLILAGAVAANVYLGHRPAVGVWAAILVAAPFRKPHWRAIPKAAVSASFLVALVFTASMMPVDRLPSPSWGSVFGLGVVSAVFDNIPLTKLAIDQNGYDWALLAYAVGFGGSLIWFGSSAGVAVSSVCSNAKSVAAWVRHGWPVWIAYSIGFFALLWIRGWNPIHL